MRANQVEVNQGFPCWPSVLSIAYHCIMMIFPLVAMLVPCAARRGATEVSYSAVRTGASGPPADVDAAERGPASLGAQSPRRLAIFFLKPRQQPCAPLRG